MLTYRYTAKDEQGNASAGLVEGADERQAADILRSRKLLITSLEVKREINILESITQGNKVSSKDLALMTRQLSTMVAAGLPLAQSLELLAKQTKSAVLKRVLKDIIRDIDGGTGFAKSLEKQGTVFPRLYVSLIKAGEASGSLDKILIQLANSLESQAEFQAKIKGALIYPVIVLVAMAGVMVIMMVFVVPQMEGVYSSLGAKLPVTTELLIGLSNLFTHQWYILIGGIVAAVYAYRAYAKTLNGKYVIADIKSKMPIFGKLGQQVELTSFVETLALLIGSGVPILEGIDIARETLSNIRFQEAAAKVAQAVEKGQPLADAMSRQSVYPPILAQMASIGEQTGKLDEVLAKVGKSFEDESSETVKNLTTALEPIIMIVLGISVGFLIFSLILPIYGVLSSF